ncbi:hypothetical protein vBAbaMD22_108 [Acinetobacter phage vB_AbaM_D22]|nr:hypothetical protein vBAbaMD22_108 [Acinetobacter phage vB_AbaM_D22]
MAKHKQETKDFKQKNFQNIRVKYGCGVCLQQGGEAVVLDKVGARKLIKELSAWVGVE